MAIIEGTEDASKEESFFKRIRTKIDKNCPKCSKVKDSNIFKNVVFRGLEDIKSK